MADAEAQPVPIGEDERTLQSLGYGQELLRGMSGFSNYAISLSMICILAGGITSFHQGLGSVGGAAIGIGWPLGALLALSFAATMGQLASAFPTAGGLYHWSSILGGRGWGWATAWFNLAGLITVLAAINVGCYLFVVGSIGPLAGLDPNVLTGNTGFAVQLAAVVTITVSQAIVNHLGIRMATRLTDFSGYWILLVAVVLTGSLLVFAPTHDVTRLVTFANYSNYSAVPAGHEVWPHTGNMLWLFALGLILPAYTITGFDASAHTSEETIDAARAVPRSIVRSVLVSGIFGWVMLCAVVLAAPSLDGAAAQGDRAFYWTVESTLPHGLAIALYVGIAVAQYLCGLATVTSVSRMVYAFARDGGLPGSRFLKRVSASNRAPATAIWFSAIFAIAFTVYTPVYSTITTVCVIFLYLSYGMPVLLGLIAYGRTWTRMGPWDLGPWYRVLAVICVAGCVLFVAIGVAPPNDKALWITLGSLALTAAVWFGFERRNFAGPPVAILSQKAHAQAADALVSPAIQP
jgi:amino acid transporter